MNAVAQIPFSFPESSFLLALKASGFGDENMRREDMTIFYEASSLLQYGGRKKVQTSGTYFGYLVD